MADLSQIRHALGEYLTRPIVRTLSNTGVTPNMLTTGGFLLSLGAAAIIALGHLFAGGLLVLFAGAFDMLDGALARAKGQSTALGALLDSTLDRLSAAALLFGVLFFCTQKAYQPEILLVYVALAGSLLTSYVMARSEGLGLKCEVGLFTRAERVIVLALGLIFNQVVIALSIVAVFAFVTVGQRLLYLWQKNKKKAQHAPQKEEK